MNILVFCLFFLNLPIQAFDIWASEESKDKWNQQSKRMRAQGFTKALKSKSNSRIIGGKNSEKGRYPYYAYIEVQTEEETFFCSATLIWEDVLLSAAHCVVDIEQSGYTITGLEAYIGLHDQGSPEDSEIREISIGVPHPSYDMETEENDILIFKLKTSVLTVFPVLLNFNATIPADGQRVETMGFGVVSESSNASLPDTLQVVSTNVISFQNCNDADSYDGAINNDLMICAGVTGGGKDACDGDSGSPLIISGSDSDFDVQIGIVSFGEGCARASFPGVYTRVSAYTSFIFNQLCIVSDNPPTECDDLTENPATTSTPIISPKVIIRAPVTSPLAFVSPPVKAPSPLASSAPIPTVNTLGMGKMKGVMGNMRMMMNRRGMKDPKRMMMMMMMMMRTGLEVNGRYRG